MKGTRVGWFSTYWRSAHPTFLNVTNIYSQDAFMVQLIIIYINLWSTNFYQCPRCRPKKNHSPCTLACTASKKNAGMWRCERSNELHNYFQMKRSLIRMWCSLPLPQPQRHVITWEQRQLPACIAASTFVVSVWLSSLSIFSFFTGFIFKSHLKFKELPCMICTTITTTTNTGTPKRYTYTCKYGFVIPRQHDLCCARRNSIS
jgi:hypothetical protein